MSESNPNAPDSVSLTDFVQVYNTLTGAEFKTRWNNILDLLSPSIEPEWGNIVGTLADQTDLIDYITAGYQPLNTNLTSWASVTRASGFDTFTATPSSANLRSLVTDETGTGALVFANTPTLVTPVLGVATATSINKVAITAPATGSTLTIADGKTFTQSNTLTYTGTDGSTVAFGTGGAVAYIPDAYFSFQFGWSVQNPADNTQYFLSSANLFNGNVAGNARIVLPVACTFIGYSFNNVNLTTNASNETSTLRIRKNNTTTTDLNTAISFAATSLVSDFTKSISFAAGDDFAASILTATWATNPVSSCMTVVFYFKRA